MNTAALDTVVYAETPEGIMIELRPAGLPSRFYAFLLDWLIRIGILYAVALVAASSGYIPCCSSSAAGVPHRENECSD